MMTREEYIANNKYIQKALKNLTKEDLQYLTYISKHDVKISTDDLRVKQLFFHMCKGVKVWELKPLLQSFKILTTFNAR